MSGADHCCAEALGDAYHDSVGGNVFGDASGCAESVLNCDHGRVGANEGSDRLRGMYGTSCFGSDDVHVAGASVGD